LDGSGSFGDIFTPRETKTPGISPFGDGMILAPPLSQKAKGTQGGCNEVWAFL
jgi:hypothetical protein